jgi:hypothetical protein
MKKQVLVGLLILSCLTPTVYADQLFPLLNTRTRITKIVDEYAVKLVTRISAPYKRGCTPPTAYKWTLYKKNVYGIYQRQKSGIVGGIKYRMYITLGGLKWKAIVVKYFFNLNPGAYKFKVFSYDGCAYHRIYATKTFTIKTSIQ